MRESCSVQRGRSSSGQAQAREVGDLADDLGGDNGASGCHPRNCKVLLPAALARPPREAHDQPGRTVGAETPGTAPADRARRRWRRSPRAAASHAWIVGGALRDAPPRARRSPRSTSPSRATRRGSRATLEAAGAGARGLPFEGPARTARLPRRGPAAARHRRDRGRVDRRRPRAPRLHGQRDRPRARRPEQLVDPFGGVEDLDRAAGCAASAPENLARGPAPDPAGGAALRDARPAPRIRGSSPPRAPRRRLCPARRRRARRRPSSPGCSAQRAGRCRARAGPPARASCPRRSGVSPGGGVRRARAPALRRWMRRVDPDARARAAPAHPARAASPSALGHDGARGAALARRAPLGPGGRRATRAALVRLAAERAAARSAARAAGAGSSTPGPRPGRAPSCSRASAPARPAAGRGPWLALARAAPAPGRRGRRRRHPVARHRRRTARRRAASRARASPPPLGEVKNRREARHWLTGQVRKRPVTGYNLDTLTLAELLKFMAKKEASDLHLKPMRPPLLRIKGRLIPLNADALQPKDLEEMLPRILTPAQKERLEAQPVRGRRLRPDGRRPLPLQHLRPARLLRRRVPPHPVQAALDHRAEPAGGPRELRPPAQGARPDHRTDRLGQVHDARRRSCARSSRSARSTSSRSRTRSSSSSPTARPPSPSARSRPTRPSFNEALKNMFRQDPDVIMVGEMRDWNTMQTAITAAETGHLVFSTLHTNSAAQSIDRIIDSCPQRAAGAGPLAALDRPPGDRLDEPDRDLGRLGPRARRRDHGQLAQDREAHPVAARSRRSTRRSRTRSTTTRCSR